MYANNREAYSAADKDTVEALLDGMALAYSVVFGTLALNAGSTRHDTPRETDWHHE